MERTERPHKKSSSSSYRDYDSSFSQVGSLKLILHVFVEVTFQKYKYKQHWFASLAPSQCPFSRISGSSSSSHLPEEIPRCKAGSVVGNKSDISFSSIRQQELRNLYYWEIFLLPALNLGRTQREELLKSHFSISAFWELDFLSQLIKIIYFSRITDFPCIIDAFFLGKSGNDNTAPEVNF